MVSHADRERLAAEVQQLTRTRDELMTALRDAKGDEAATLAAAAAAAAAAGKGDDAGVGAGGTASGGDGGAGIPAQQGDVLDDGNLHVIADFLNKKEVAEEVAADATKRAAEDSPPRALKSARAAGP